MFLVTLLSKVLGQNSAYMHKNTTIKSSVLCYTKDKLEVFYL